MADKIIRVLSLGAGVQSTTVLLLSIRGILPKVDCAVFADTWEPQPVYKHLEWLKSEAEAAGVPVHIVCKGNIREDILEGQIKGTCRFASMPLHTQNAEGKRSILKRQCTRDYKVDVINKFLRRDILGLQPRQRASREHTIDHWFGISADESSRMRMSGNKWERYVYPLCGVPEFYLPGPPWTRTSCETWLQENYPHREIVKSACIVCPYRSNAEWRWLRDKSPDDWQAAIDFDRKIRRPKGLNDNAYVHRSCVPLDEVNLSTSAEKGEPTFWDNECAGMCGV